MGENTNAKQLLLFKAKSYIKIHCGLISPKQDVAGNGCSSATGRWSAGFLIYIKIKGLAET